MALSPTSSRSGSGGGSLAAISQTVVLVAAASVTLSSIPGTYESLVVVYNVRGDGAASPNLLMRCNGDTGANYDAEEDDGVGATAAAGGTSGGTSAQIGGIASAGNRASNSGVGQILIPGYARTVFLKHWCVVFSDIRSAVLGDRVVGNAGGVWNNTAAITSLTFLLSAGNLDVGSVITLYGLAAS